MHETSALYKELFSEYQTGMPGVKFETKLIIGDVVLGTIQGEVITFGGVAIRANDFSPEDGYGDSVLVSLETDSRMFSEDNPTVGDCISSQIDIKMLKPSKEIPTMARLVPYVRLTDGTRHSEWIQKGVFYIDTRAKKEDGSEVEKLNIHGYDDMLKAEQDYPISTLRWPAKDIDVVREIAGFINVPIDERTASIINRGYTIEYPTGYSCRETLGYIASMYAGCFVMSDLGKLRLIKINGIPSEI